MRIVAGEYRGRRLEKPSDKRVRVTTERVREAVFSILGSKMEGARFLDLFAGSGIIGLEAISRGAIWVDFVEILPASLSAISNNVKALDLRAKTRIHRGDALRYAERLGVGGYDVAFADPPFTSDLAVGLLESFRHKAFAKTLCIEHRSTLTCTGDDTRRYGDISLTFCYSL